MSKQLAIAALLMGVGLVSPCSVLLAQQPHPSAAQSQAPPGSWRKEFDEVCSKTQDAELLSEKDLTDLIRRCDALAPRIDKLDDSQKKIFGARLRMCRGLYAYVLDSKKNSTANGKK